MADRHGVVLPGEDARSNWAAVVAVGDLVEDVSVGDLVYMRDWGGYVITIDGDPFITMDVSHVLAKVET